MINCVQFTQNGIKIGDRDFPLYCGSFHYWRSNVEHWPAIIDEIKFLGFNIIETYIPWGVHEISKKEYDFGSIDSNKNLKKFLSLCKDKDVFVILRPGPHINAELDCFGFPERIVFTPEYMARTPMGSPVVYPYATRPFPIPSYSSRDFMSEVINYFDEVYKQIDDYIFPNGPIISLQVDNEYCYFFRDNAYTLDYSKANITLYHEYLKKLYKRIENLNNHYHSSFDYFYEVSPPIGFSLSNMAKCYDWVLFKENSISETLKKISKYWKEKGMGIPLFHNVAYQYYTPININQLENTIVDVVGMDMYLYPKQFKEIRRKAKYLAGSNQLAFIPEFISGVWFDNPNPPTIDDQEFLTLYALMHGIKAINFYMLVERDRWFGCPVSVDAKKNEAYYNLFHSLITFLKDIKFWELQRSVSVALVKNYELGRFKAIYSEADFSPFKSNAFVNGMEIPSNLFRPEPCLDLSFEKENYKHWAEEPWLEEIEDILSGNGIDYNVLDTNSDFLKLENYEVIYISSFERMSKILQEKIVKLMKVHPSVFLNCIPTQDLDGYDCKILSDFCSHYGPDNQYLEKFVKQNLSDIEFVEYRGNGSNYIFVANTSSFPNSGTICTPSYTKATKIWGTGLLSIEVDGFSVALSPNSVSVWEVYT